MAAQLLHDVGVGVEDDAFAQHLQLQGHFRCYLVGKPLGENENLLRLLDFLYRLEDSIDGELVDGVADFRQGLVENLVDVRGILLDLRMLGKHVAKLRKAGDAAFLDGAGDGGRG